MNVKQVARTHNDEKATFGFWLYLMTDIILFGALFATYMILRNNTADGPSGSELFEAPMVLLQTMILLLSSLSVGIALIALEAKKLRIAVGLLVATLTLGLCFVGLELAEFSHLASHGASWQVSAFLSAFFTLVGTHGLHIFFGLVWGSVLLGALQRRGATERMTHKFRLFALFWHFLDLVWIFIFTIVYLGGLS